jgi:hypothetical protein
MLIDLSPSSGEEDVVDQYQPLYFSQVLEEVQLPDCLVL